MYRPVKLHASACVPTHASETEAPASRYIYIYIWRDNESEPEPSAFPRAVFRVEQGPVCTVQHTSSSSTVQIDPTSLHHRNLLISLHRAFYKPFDYVSIHWKKWEINGKTGMTKEILFFLERDETWSLLEATIFNQIEIRGLVRTLSLSSSYVHASTGNGEWSLRWL